MSTAPEIAGPFERLSKAADRIEDASAGIEAATNAIESVEDSLANLDGGSIGREGLHAILYLARGKLREMTAQIDSALEDIAAFPNPKEVTP